MPIWLLASAILLTSCSHTYYVVRHAEKAAQGSNMTSDVPLSDAGQQRALALMESLKDKKIDSIFSTNTIRTRSTAQPTADHFKTSIATYGPMPNAEFIARMKAIKKNVLIVGHSNTVDDIVNGLTGQKSVAGDLTDSQYDNLYVIRIKGKKAKFEAKKYGVLTP